jgi:hypothetical protein
MQQNGGVQKLSESSCAQHSKASLDCAWAKLTLKSLAYDYGSVCVIHNTSVLYPKYSPTPFTAGLSRNNYDKAACQHFFEQYKACRQEEVDGRRERRLQERAKRKAAAQQ